MLSEAGHGIRQRDLLLTDLAGGPSYVGCFECSENHPFTSMGGGGKEAGAECSYCFVTLLFSWGKMIATLELIHLKIHWQKSNVPFK